MFPLIANRLGEVTADTPLKTLLESSQRWARMRALINRQQAETIGCLFNEADLPLVWTKGTALANRIDQRPELRPSSDLDALIRWQDTERVIELARQQKWTPNISLRKNRKRARYLDSEISFYMGREGALDLAWKPRTPFTYDPFISNWIWETSHQKDCNGILFACDTWLLLETIEHGLYVNSVYPIRWVIDAVRLIDTCKETIDWPMLLDLSARYRLTHLLFTALKIVEKYTENIPEWVWAKQKRFRPSLLDKAEFRVRIISPDLDTAYPAFLALNRLRREPLHLWTKLPPIRINNTTVGIFSRTCIPLRNMTAKMLTNAEKTKKKITGRINRLRNPVLTLSPRNVPPHSRDDTPHTES